MFESLEELWPSSASISLVAYLIPLVLVLAVAPHASHATQEFHVDRMQQYDMPYGNALGSRSGALSAEAYTVRAKPAVVSRRCVLAKLDEFTLERYRTLVANYVSAIIVIMPAKRGGAVFADTHKQSIHALEASLLHEEVVLCFFVCMR